MLRVLCIFNLSDAIADLFRGVINELFSAGLKTFSSLTKVAISLLTKTPEEWNSAAWLNVKDISTAFVAVGSSLVAFFFLMGLFLELNQSRFETKLERVLFDVMKLLIAEYFVVNNFKIVSNFCKLGVKLCGFVIAASSDDMTLNVKFPDSFYNHLDELGGGQTFILVIISLIFVGVMICAGGSLVLSSFKRFFKLLVIIPWGSVAASTFAGNNQIATSGVSFWKMTLNTIFETVTMLMAIVGFAKIFGSGDLIFFTSSEMNSCSDFEYCFIYMIERGLLVLTCATVVSSAAEHTRRALGL